VLARPMGPAPCWSVILPSSIMPTAGWTNAGRVHDHRGSAAVERMVITSSEAGRWVCLLDGVGRPIRSWRAFPNGQGTPAGNDQRGGHAGVCRRWGTTADTGEWVDLRSRAVAVTTRTGQRSARSGGCYP
jgi:hypothetical protein